MNEKRKGNARDTALEVLLSGSALRLVIENFLAVALVEEACKRWVVMKFAWNHPAFDYRFDAVVYCVFVALGFAALENVQYVLEYGPSVIVSRGLLSIPAHGIFGIYMGLFYANARYADIYRNGAGHRWNMCAALLVPVLLHGFFDFCLMSGSVLLGFIFFGFVVAMDAVSIKLVRRQSREDRPF